MIVFNRSSRTVMIGRMEDSAEVLSDMHLAMDKMLALRSWDTYSGAGANYDIGLVIDELPDGSMMIGFGSIDRVAALPRPGNAVEKS